ncbi:hypothetical protein KW801_01850 [Candidatus Saccharibacteria bacterium]|nr:hypothetical protein [Candidatus Saccharibacteria bacterium]
MEPQTSQPVSYSSGAGSGRNILFTVLLGALLVISLVFGGWAFKNMQDYKNNSDKKTTAAVAVAVSKAQRDQKTQDEQANKSPNKVFHGSPTYGSISFNYPKTWSAYVDTTNSSEPINAYFHPDVVPGIQSKTAYALRLELLSTDYAQVVQQLSSQIQQGKITARAYLPPKLNRVANVQPGTLFSGQINVQDPTQRGTLLVIKVRDKTLEISTQSNDYLSDFNNGVLSNLSFAP